MAQGVFRHAEYGGQSLRGTSADGAYTVSATRQTSVILPDRGGGSAVVGSASTHTGEGLNGYDYVF